MVGQGWRLARTYRDLSRHPVGLDEAMWHVTEQRAARTERLVVQLDQQVWPFPDSPTRRLLSWAGVERGDIVALLADGGLEGALESLRDQGVYVAYEEYLGTVPAIRGSASFDFRPDDFRNRLFKADYMTSSGGTRSGGTTTGSNLTHLRSQCGPRLVQLATWDIDGAPTALWRPVFPGSAITSVLQLAGAGNRPERWFSQVDPRERAMAPHKRLANRGLGFAGVVGIPRPRHVPMSAPEPVLAWVEDALRREGRALLQGLTSSVTRLGAMAGERGVRLDGLVGSLSGEPLTPAKVAVLASAGARVANSYAFSPLGRAGFSCPFGEPEEPHLWDSERAVVTRRRPRADGVEVDAFCWTTLVSDAPAVWLNVENDDYGVLARDDDCSCLMGRLGFSTRFRQIRSLSKVVAGGGTLPGEVLQRLAEEELPRRFGGSPTDYQFVEEEVDGSTVVSVRVDPRLGSMDEGAVLEAVSQTLVRSEEGMLAERLWSSTLRLVRTTPVTTAGGKMLPFESLVGARRPVPER